MTRHAQPAPPAPRPVDSTTRPPQTEAEAERILARHSYLQARRAEHQELYDIEVARLDAWLKEQNDPLQVELERVARLLREWHEGIFRSDPQRRRVSLPSGTLALGSDPRGTSDVLDSDVLLAWTEANFPEAVTPAKPATVNLSDLRKRARPKDKSIEPGAVTELVDTATGEVIPGVKLRGTARSWEIK